MTSPRSIAFLWVLAVCALLSPASRAAPPSDTWRAVLVAGDDAQPVFDNATAALRRFLVDSGTPRSNIQRFSAAANAADPAAQPATGEQLMRAITTLRPGIGERCLVFITSHGQQGEGVWLARAGEILQPAVLAQGLAVGCGAVPTVVIVSACYSGSFAAGPMRAPNRIVLTAARADRPSFGCQADRTYTFYDQCLLAALPRAASWRAVHSDTAACVRRSERALGARPSQPQAWFGAAIRDLPVR